MVNAAIHALAQPDSEVGMCRTHSGMFVERDTGQVPCVRVPKIETRLVAFKPDSGGACIWIENVYPESVPRVDGGPTAVRVARAGGLLLAERGREACIAQQPPNER